MGSKRKRATTKSKSGPKAPRYHKKRDVVKKSKSKSVRRTGVSSSFRSIFNTFFNSPMPQVFFTKLKYNQQNVLNVGASGVIGAVQKFNLNTLYDPDQTGTGHQPSGYDELTNFYSRFKVCGCRVEITFDDPSQDGLAGVMRITNPATYGSTIAGATPNVVLEQEQSSKIIMMNNSGAQKKYLSFYCDIWKIAGVTKLQFDADPDNYTGNASGNPASLCGLEIGIFDLHANVSTSPTIIVNTTVTYYSQFYQRKTLSQS